MNLVLVNLIILNRTVKMGYPVVNVTRNSKNKIKISQKWFLINPLSKVLNRKADYENTKWYIPFTYTTQQQNVFQFESKPEWLKPSDTEKEITLPDESDWIIGNLHHSGFYRVNYDNNNWNKLIEQLETDHTKILNINRATLLDDSFNLGRSGLIDQTKFFETVKYLSKEEDSLAFQAAFYGLDFINDIVSSNSETSALFKV
jgi:aminopeptidase N